VSAYKVPIPVCEGNGKRTFAATVRKAKAALQITG
jgi:hypothetical protein